jgi:glutamyl-tRNAGlu reductase-like protein
MSGTIVGRALERYFDQVRRKELDRLTRKLAGLSPSDRAAAEAVIADVIRGVGRVPAIALAGAPHDETLEAIVHLFRLDVNPSATASS